MRRIIPNAYSARHVAAAEAHDLDGDDISDAARAIYDAEPPADHLGESFPRPLYADEWPEQKGGVL